jgi:hypothetical protein
VNPKKVGRKVLKLKKERAMAKVTWKRLLGGGFYSTNGKFLIVPAGRNLCGWRLVPTLGQRRQRPFGSFLKVATAKAAAGRYYS